MSSFKLFETDVTVSELLIANSITGLNDLSLPISVISVPCKVVTIGNSLERLLKICFADSAADA